MLELVLSARSCCLALALCGVPRLANAQTAAEGGPPGAPAQEPPLPAPLPAPGEAPSAPVEPPPSAPAEPPPSPDQPPAPSTPPAPAPPAAGEFAPLPPDSTPPPSQVAPAPPAAPPPASPPSALAPAPAAAAPSAERPRRAPSPGAAEPPVVRHYGDDDPEASDQERTDNFKIGPLLGLGIPSLFSFGGTLKLTRFLGAGVNVGIIPKVQLSVYGDATLSYQHYDIYGRLYPFGGGFFLGAGAGYATVRGTLTKTLDVSAYTAGIPGLPASIAYKSEGSVRTLMLTLLIGYLHTFRSGFSLGIDAGAQLPIAPSQVDFKSGVAGDYPEELVRRYLDPTDQSVKDTLEKIGRTTLPTVNLRIGWIL